MVTALTGLLSLGAVPATALSVLTSPSSAEQQEAEDWASMLSLDPVRMAVARAGLLEQGSGTPASAASGSTTGSRAERADTDSSETLRVATVHSSLSRSAEGELLTELSSPGSTEAETLAARVQTLRPEVLLVTGIDVDAPEAVAEALNTNYLAPGQGGRLGMHYPYVYAAPVNTGVDTGADLNDDGMVGGPEDAFTRGDFPGQSGMILYSVHPIQQDGVRTFQRFLWSSLPQNTMPRQDYTALEAATLRLSSTSHWDVPVTADGRTVHLLVSGATGSPDTSPGAEARSADELRFWEDYVAGADYPVDDDGRTGGLAPGSEHVVLETAGAPSAPPSASVR